MTHISNHIFLFCFNFFFGGGWWWCVCGKEHGLITAFKERKHHFNYHGSKTSNYKVYGRFVSRVLMS